MIRFAAVLARVPRYLRLAYRLTRDERLTPRQRALAAAGAAYLAAPICAIPGFIPVVGQLDDLAVLLLTLRRALRSCPPEVAAEHLRQAGVTFAAIDADLAAIRATALWVALETGRLVHRVAGRLAGGALARVSSTFRRTPSRDA
jgi:uncharacterized membrane protein YkvA (DUF1232 family)